jgi:hypothetical protein
VAAAENQMDGKGKGERNSLEIKINVPNDGEQLFHTESSARRKRDNINESEAYN